MTDELRTYADAARASDDAASEYEAQARDLRIEGDRATSRRTEVQAGITERIQSLTALLLPTFDEANCTQVANSLGVPQLSAVLTRLMGDRRTAQSRLSQIPTDPYFENERQIARREEEIGELRVERDDMQRVVDDLGSDDELMQLYGAKHLPQRSSLIDILLKIILIGFLLDYLKAKRLAKVLQMHDATNVDHLFERYDNAVAKVRELNPKIATKAAELKRAQSLVGEHNELSQKLEGFEERALGELRSTLVQALNGFPAETWKDLRPNVRSELRLVITTVIALKGKLAYLETLEDKLSEESRKLSERALKLRDVARKWRRRPSYELTTDLRPRLIDGPARMRRRTNMFVRRSNSMCDVIWLYDDYDALDFMLEMGTEYLLWDVMVGGYAEPILFPDAFAIYLFEEIADWRDEHGGPEYTEDIESPSALDVPEPGGDFGEDPDEEEDLEDFEEVDDGWDDDGDDGWDDVVEPEPERTYDYGGGYDDSGSDNSGWDSGGSDYDSGGSDYDDDGGWDD